MEFDFCEIFGEGGIEAFFANLLCTILNMILSFIEGLFPTDGDTT